MIKRKVSNPIHLLFLSTIFILLHASATAPAATLTIRNDTVLTINIYKNIRPFKGDEENYYATLNPCEFYAAKVSKGEVWVIRDATTHYLIHWVHAAAADETLTLTEDYLTSHQGTQQVNARFINKTGQKINVYWISQEGEEKLYQTLANEEMRMTLSFSGHLWKFADLNGNTLGLIYIPLNAPELTYSIPSTAKPLCFWPL
jgi:hypothetical protein